MNNDTTNAAEENIDLTDEETVDLFIEGLMEEKGALPESEELRQDIFTDLKTRLMEELDRSLVAELPDEKLEELSKKAEAEGKLDPQEVAQAVADANLNLEEIVGTTMAKFRELYLGEDKPTENETGAAEDGAE